jgi:hypothetical protein
MTMNLGEWDDAKADQGQASRYEAAAASSRGGRSTGAVERPAEERVGLAPARGEPLDAVSQGSRVPGYDLESWKRAFLEGAARRAQQLLDGLKDDESAETDPDLSADPVLALIRSSLAVQ